MDKESELNTHTNSNYSKVIKASSWLFATIIAVIVIKAAFIEFFQDGPDGQAAAGIAGLFAERKNLLVLIMMPVGGCLLGVAVAVLFAPKSYLLSSDGKKWMKLVGTKTIITTRIISLIFALLGLAFFTFWGLAVFTDNFKKPIFG